MSDPSDLRPHTELQSRVAEQLASLVDLRRDLHAHPEASWEEVRTTSTIISWLRERDVASTPLVGTTGLYVDIGEGGPLVVLRADLDALRMQDEKSAGYKSQNPGLCHACGHDVHAAAAAGAAVALSKVGLGGSGRVRIVFQPAEETIPSGARMVVDSGIVEDASAAFALHCDPRLKAGQIGVSEGLMTSAADRVEITINGPGGHSARPQETVDVVYVLGRLATELPAVLGRLIDPRDAVSLTFGSIHAGDAANVIPTSGMILGSLRAGSRRGWSQAGELLPGLVEALAGPLGAVANLRHQRGAPPIDNRSWASVIATRAAGRVVGADSVLPSRQSTGGEDFSWFMESAPGAFVRLGVSGPFTPKVDIHCPTFDVDEECLGVGAEYLATVALEALDELRSAGPEASFAANPANE